MYIWRECYEGKKSAAFMPPSFFDLSHLPNPSSRLHHCCSNPAESFFFFLPSWQHKGLTPSRVCLVKPRIIKGVLHWLFFLFRWVLLLLFLSLSIIRTCMKLKSIYWVTSLYYLWSHASVLRCTGFPAITATTGHLDHGGRWWWPYCIRYDVWNMVS